MSLEYKGIGEHVNPNSVTAITIAVQDWNGEYWMFYADIDMHTYSEDCEEISELIEKLNWRDGDVRIELIDYNSELTGLYEYFEMIGANFEILDTDYWDVWDDRGDDFFEAYSELNGGHDFSDLKNTDYTIYEDKWELVEELYGELWGKLQEYNVTHCFDVDYLIDSDPELLKMGDGRIAVESER